MFKLGSKSWILRYSLMILMGFLTVAYAQMSHTDKALALLKAFETGEKSALDYVADEYIQHNLAFPDGKEVLSGFITGEATGITVNIHRSFADGDFVVLHSSYGGVWNNATPQVGFDVFRFKDGLIVEHWDNLADEVDDGDGTSQTDGAVTPATDLELTEANRVLMQQMTQDLFISGDWSKLREYFNVEAYKQHSVGAGADGSFLASIEGQTLSFYTSIEFIYVEGNFGISLAQGPDITGQDSEGIYAYYDLFRIENGKIVEHWDVIQRIPSEAANANGKW